MSNFKESDHPRDSDGKFTQKGVSGYTDKVNERIAWAKDKKIDLPLNADGSINDIALQRIQKMSAAELSKALQKELPQKKMSPEEKIASVHIDFDRDNILPELNEEYLAKIGADKNKPVLLKKSVIDRNRTEHKDVSKDDMKKIICRALYHPDAVFAANGEKPYYHFASFVEMSEKGKQKIGMVLLDVDKGKDNFEIVHMHYVNPDGLQRALKKANKKRLM